jgi:hypothetical protein
MVSVLAFGPKVRGFKPGTPSFRDEVKMSANVVRFCGILENPSKFERNSS